MWRRFVYWQGTTGFARMITTNYSAQPSSTPGTLDNTIASMSNAGISQIAEGTVTVFTPAPVSAVYPSVTDVAVLNGLDSAGFAFRIFVPAPKASIFEADGITVQPSYLSSVLTAALLDGFVSPQGNSPSSLVSGELQGG